MIQFEHVFFLNAWFNKLGFVVWGVSGVRSLCKVSDLCVVHSLHTRTGLVVENFSNPTPLLFGAIVGSTAVSMVDEIR